MCLQDFFVYIVKIIEYKIYSGKIFRSTFSSDCCTQSFFPTVERLDNKLRESLHTNRASLSLALLGRAASRPYKRAEQYPFYNQL